jgi:L-galactose dehydrogenase
MRFSMLGSTDLRVSALGFGAAPLGQEYGAVSVAEGERAVAAAIDAGINLFDVSPYYGRTLAEERLGRALAGRRDEVVLVTKVGRYGPTLPDGFDFSAARVDRSVVDSLRRLRTDVIDLYLAHDIEFGSREVVLQETLPTMKRLKEEGKVRYVGISGYPLELLRDVAEEAGVDAVLSYCHYDLLNTRLDEVLAPAAARSGFGLINASPLHMGVLTREGPPSWNPAPERVLAAARSAAEWCAARGADLPDLALRFALANASVAATLVGMRTAAEVEKNLAALEPGPYDSLIPELREMLRPVLDVEWPSGLPENNPLGPAR